MGHKYIALHKNEWERLKRQGDPPAPQAPDPTGKEEFLQGLIQQSQQWVTSWKGSVQKERRHQREIELVKSHESQKQKKLKNTEALNKARQMIFDGTSHGHQLISALLESQAIEERELQNKLKNEMKKEAETPAMQTPDYFGLNSKEENTRQKKSKDKELALNNKTIYEMKKERIANDKAEERQLELEDARLTKLMLDFEAQEMEHCRRLERQAIKEHLAEQKKIREERTKRDSQAEALAKAWLKYQDRVRCGEKLVMDRIHKDRDDTTPFKNNYELIQKVLQDKSRSYKEFVEKGILQLDDRLLKEEKKDKEEDRQKQLDLLSLTQINKKAAEIRQIKQGINKCVCERQSLFTKSHQDRLKKDTKYEAAPPPPSFLEPTNKLLRELKRREKDASPYNGLKGAHAQFAARAGAALGQCRHKAMARKVVNEYRKLNCLDATTLPVANY